MSEVAREVREIESTGAWLDWRREDLTASRIPALWNLHPYLSREQLADIMRATTSAGSGTPPDNSVVVALDLWRQRLIGDSDLAGMRVLLAAVAASAIEAVLARRLSEAARTGPWDTP